ncbi:MAG: hypothetical protein K2I75_07535 [Clostridiales bacterium]|nr:hypothetical protein [Clostridiales bacterium]
MARRHDFNFEGGEELTTMSASWFVSYGWYDKVDSAHTNWSKVKESIYKSRISVYNRTKSYHKYWLKHIITMSENKLNSNTIGLSGRRIIEMANELLKI